MKTQIIILTICLGGLLDCFGQSDQITRNNFYFEAGGAAFFYSLNYERLLLNNSQHNIATRIGIFYLPTFNHSSRVLKGVPVSVSYLKKMKNKYLEGGVSFSALTDQYSNRAGSGNAIHDFTSIKDLVLIPSVRFGIRKQPVAKGLFWNALIQGSLIAVGDVDNYDFKTAEKSGLPFLSLGMGYSL